MEEPKKTDAPVDGVDSLETPDTVVESTPAEKAASANRNQKFDFQSYVRTLISRVNIYLLLFVFILVIAGVILFVAIQQSKNQAVKDQTSTQKLTADALKNLAGSDAKVGDPKQLLTIESNAVFSGKVLIRDSLDVAGAIKVGGALSLPGITVSGTSQFDQVQLNSLAVSSNESIQGSLTIQKGLSVGGNGAFGGTVSAGAISTDKLILNQDLQLNRHIAAGGTTPGISPGGAIGGGGTVSINGSDSAGTVTVNNGGGFAPGTVATVTFSNRFNGSAHAVITPVCPGPCNLGSYIVGRTSNGFSIGVSANPGGTYSFDYVVLD